MNELAHKSILIVQCGDNSKLNLFLKSRGHRTSKIVKSKQSLDELICLFYDLARALMHDVACHSRPQRPRSFWSTPRIATSGLVQRHSVFEWLCKHNRLTLQPIRFVRLDSEHAQSDGKSVNRGLPVLDLARGRACAVRMRSNN